jgi:molybdopterin converting factor subunit 1
MSNSRQASSVTRQVVVHVLLFAQLRDALGQSEVTVELPQGASGKDLFEVLAARGEKVKGLLKISRLAVGQAYVSWDHPLREGEEVAVIPPVSGG